MSDGIGHVLNTYAVITFIHGPDRFLAHEAARSIAARSDPDGVNTSWVDGKEISVEQIVASIGAVSFFGGARVVVVSDFLARTSRDAASPAEESESRPSKQITGLTELVEAVPENHHLIFLESTLLSAPAALKSAAPHATIFAAEPPRGSELTAWIGEAAIRAGSRIDRRAAQFLAETLYPQTWNAKPNNPRYDRPPDMARITGEVEKLALSAHPDPISTKHVEDLVTGGPDRRLFRFIDAAVAGDVATATTELDRLMSAGEEPALLLAQALGQIELLTIAQTAGRRDASTVARDLGSISSSRISAIANSARRLGQFTSNMAEIAVQIDRRLKTGRIRRPEDALHQLIAELAACRQSTHVAGRQC